MQHKRFLLGPVHFYRQALGFAIPVMIQTFVQSLVSLIDNFMVGGLGDIKMSAVNITNQFTFLFLVTVGTFAETGGMFMSQFNGAKDAGGMPTKAIQNPCQIPTSSPVASAARTPTCQGMP